MKTISCANCEERMSDYLEKSLDADWRLVVELHLSSCRECTELMSAMRDVMDWGKAFPVYEAPTWLPTRIIANTPRVARETWLDTLSAVGRWFIEPRTAMGLLTSVLMIGWMSNLVGIRPDISTIVRNPAAIYYGAGDMVNRAYDRAIRSFYHARVVTQIQSQIERLREIS